MLVRLKQTSRILNTQYLIVHLFALLALSAVYLLYASQALATDPVPTPYVPCKEIRPPNIIDINVPVIGRIDISIGGEWEFNSLRPYQASPCKEPPPSPPTEPQALLCGNNLVFKEKFTKEASEGNCTTSPDGGRRCTYKENSTVDITVDLTKSELPILGNTESVPNAKSNTETLTEAERINEYVSWYLNGTLNRGEYLPLGPNPIDYQRLVDLSGPLNKLLPQRIQWNQREKTIQNAQKSTDENEEIRHNQIVGCVLQGFYGEVAYPCYGIDQTNLSGEDLIALLKLTSASPGALKPLDLLRLTDWIKNAPIGWENALPPKEEAFEKFEDYWKSYLTWRGELCSPTLTLFGKSLYACVGSPSNFYAWMFPNIPYASTEDKKGEIEFAANTFLSGENPATSGEASIISQSFAPRGDTKKFVYFPHTAESAELGELLQNTYLPSDIDGYTPKLTAPFGTTGTGAQPANSSSQGAVPPSPNSNSGQDGPFLTDNGLYTCVAFAGDSVLHGNLNYARPEDGQFPIFNSGSVASFTKPKLPSGFTVEEETQAATTLSTIPNEDTYNSSSVVSSKCKYKVIGPWVNDIGKGGLEPTQTAIVRLYNQITQENPDSTVLVVNYYHTSPIDWALNIWPKINDQSRVETANGLINSVIPEDKIVGIADFTPNQLAINIFAEGQLRTADGVHLSDAGKEELSKRIADKVKEMEKDANPFSDSNNNEGQNNKNDSQPNVAGIPITGQGFLDQGCEILDSRTNPGDDIFGEHVEEGDNLLGGDLTYSVEFTCDFPAARPRNFCEANCEPEDQECMNACLGNNQTCDQEVFIEAGSVYTKIPNAEELWQRFVDGSASVFKRFFPQVGPNSPVTEIKDIPAVTSADYTASHKAGAGTSTEAFAGNPGNTRPGSSAQLFFSHIGSVSEYFVKGIQAALRPKGFAEQPISGSQNLDIHPPVSDWDLNDTPITDPPPDNPEIQTAIEQAANDIGIPVCVLEGVGIIEGAYGWAPDDPRVAQCTPNQCSAAGPFQISTGRDANGDRFCSQCSAWTRANGCPNVWAGRSGSPCDFNLAGHVAAEKLKNDGPLNDAQSVQSQRNQIINAGYHYYGSNEKIARLGNCSYGQYVYKHCDASYSCN